MPILVWVAAAIRFVLPILDSPYKRISSDMQVHFDCGRYVTLFSLFSANRSKPPWLGVDCEIAGAVEPKPFQLLMAIVTRVEPLVGASLFGAMAAGLVVFLFLTLKRAGFSNRRNLFTVFLIAFCPTLLWCFNYFLNQTLMLFLLVGGLFSVIHSLDPKLDPHQKFNWNCISFWLILFSTLTKMVVLPCLAAWLFLFGPPILTKFREKIKSLGIQAFTLFFILVWFALSTYHQTGFLNPFGKSLQSILLRQTGSCTTAFTLVDEETKIEHGFGTRNSPVCSQPFFAIEKFGALIPIHPTAAPIRISKQWAPLRWSQALAEQTNEITPHQKLSIWWQNLAAGLTTASFPEVYREDLFHDSSLLSRLGIWSSEVILFPLFFLLVTALGIALKEVFRNRSLLFQKNGRTWSVFLSISIVLTWAAFIVQQEGVFEPRYRKALDLLSFLLVAHFLFINRKNKRDLALPRP